MAGPAPGSCSRASEPPGRCRLRPEKSSWQAYIGSSTPGNLLVTTTSYHDNRGIGLSRRRVAEHWGTGGVHVHGPLALSGMPVVVAMLRVRLKPTVPRRGRGHDRRVCAAHIGLEPQREAARELANRARCVLADRPGSLRHHSAWCASCCPRALREYLLRRVRESAGHLIIDLSTTGLDRQLVVHHSLEAAINGIASAR